jgi:hypothetical protein
LIDGNEIVEYRSLRSLYIIFQILIYKILNNLCSVMGENANFHVILGRDDCSEYSYGPRNGSPMEAESLELLISNRPAPSRTLRTCGLPHLRWYLSFLFRSSLATF